VAVAAEILEAMSYEIHEGDCIASMKAMPEKSVHCCVTSPPYFGLRDYGHDGQIGLEESPDAYVAKMVEVFREVRRVLRDDGTVWLNLGDSYAATGGKAQPHRDSSGGIGNKGTRGEQGYHAAGGGFLRPNTAQNGLKPKDLIGIPWRVAFALQADGWYLRQDIIWHKPNPMPESVRDRCTKAHEYIFLLSKNERYYFDSEAMQEPATYIETEPRVQFSSRRARAINREPSGNEAGKEYLRPSTRNRRSVWTVTTKPYKGAHFATFPKDLIRPCILAGCPIGGTVLDPFGGSGTTAQVAIEEQRSAILCELNPDYIALAEKRLSGTQVKLM
jgi:site-specific DNA-methyltransferase (adenine-specific)